MTPPCVCVSGARSYRRFWGGWGNAEIGRLDASMLIIVGSGKVPECLDMVAGDMVVARLAKDSACGVN